VLGATAAAASASVASAASAVAAAIAGVAEADPFAVGGGSSPGASGRGGISTRGRARGRGRGGQGSARGAATSVSSSSPGGGFTGGENVFLSVVHLMRQQQTRSAAEADRRAQFLMEMTTSGSGSTRLTGSPGRGGGAGAAAAGGVPGTASATAKHLMWPPGRRDQFLAQHVFECAYVSQLSARELALVSPEQGIGSGPQALNPDLESRLISAAEGKFLFGASITCCAVSAAEFAERLCSTRVNVNNSILLVMLDQWMETFVREQRRISAAAAAGSAAVGGTGLREEDVDEEQSNSAQLERSGGCGTDRGAGRGSGGASRRGAGRGAGGGAVAGYPSMGRGANHAAARRVVVSDSDEEDDDGEEDDGEGDNF